MQQPNHTIKIRGPRKRRVAEAILKRHHVKASSTTPPTAIRVVCISDTHNTRPVLPAGDVLIHAGDLTENGSFDEVQAGISWLSSQPHRYKILVAGNHDVLLDEAFLERYPERRYGETRTKRDLDWGSVTYLEDARVTLSFPVRELYLSNRQDSNAVEPTTESEVRTLTVFGSPWTKQYGVSAFQYPPNSTSHWADRLSSLGPDVLVTHGPPRLHLDRTGVHRAGCPYLAEQVARLRPRLHVFGHIHVSYGREDVVLDAVQRGYERVEYGWSGWGTVAWMVAHVLWGKVKWFLHLLKLKSRKEKVTTFVNAAVVGGRTNELRNPPILVDI
ncbi:hypothetical protein VTK56DRAFT_8815 [Thermocarpiscus australiensis]